MATFESCTAAVEFCAEGQRQLLSAPWPPLVLKRPSACVTYNEDVTAILWRGPRVAMAVHYGSVNDRPVGERGPRFFGYHYALVRGLGAAARDGQILITQQAYSAVQAGLEKLKRHVDVLPKGMAYVSTTHECVAVFQVFPASSRKRRGQSPAQGLA